MGSRAAQAADAQRQVAQAHLRYVSAAAPADQIEKAHQLLAAGVVSEDEFAKLKSQALA